MPAKILVSLTARSARLALFERGQLNQIQHFEEAEAAWAAFDALLQRHPKTPIHLMVDTVDEEYRTETLPHVRGGARREMLQRKSSQLLRTAQYRASWLQGREAGAGRRRDDVYLFLALNSGDWMRPFLDRIQRHHAPLAGIYLLPQVSQALVKLVPSAAPATLLVSLQAGGLRQSFFLNGRLRISRLTPIDAQGETELTGFCADEIEKTRLYLHNGRLLSRDARLVAQVLDFTGSLQGLPARLPQDAGFACQRLGFDEVTAATRGATTQLPRDSEALHLYLLGKSPPSVSLAPPQITGDYTVHQWRTGLYAASAVMAGLAVLWSGYNLYRDHAHEAETALVQVQTVRYRAQYDAAARHFPAAPVSSEKLRRAVEAAATIQRMGRTPDAFLHLVARGMAAFPQIQLNRLDWKYAAPAAPAAANSPWHQQGELDAEIRPFAGDYRAALADIERFGATLRGQPGVAEVTIAKLPVNLDSTSSLRGSTRDQDESRPGRAQFTLHIVLKPEA